MRWECGHCKREFSKSFALSQHVSQKHPYNQASTSHTVMNEQLDDVWNVQEYSSSYYDSFTDSEVCS
jgi:hypothetical protein